MGERTIRQHYVPEFYLRNFTRSKKGISAKSVEGKECIVSISQVAQRFKYYDIELLEDNLTERGKTEFALEDDYVFMDGEKRVLSIEKWFKIYEDIVSKIFTKILIGKIISGIDKTDREDIAFFIASLFMRGPESKRLFDTKVSKSIGKRKLFDECFKSPINNNDYDKLNWEITFMNLINEEANNLLYGKIWSLVYPRDGAIHFVTSDNPVALYLPKEYQWSNPSSMIGLRTRMVQIFLPLSRNCLLQIVDQRYWESGFSPIPIYSIDSNRVALMNSLQERQAFSWIFIGG